MPWPHRAPRFGRELASRLEANGCTLQTIVVTHGHADHCFGAGMIAARFPGATGVSTETVCTDIADSVAVQKSMSNRLLEDPVVAPSQLPEPMRGDTIDLDGHEVQVTDVGQGDTAPSAIVHIPELRTVMAGEVVYNKIHQMLAFSTPAQWIAGIDYIEGLAPRIVVAGHKKPNAADHRGVTLLNESRRYIEDVAEAVRRRRRPATSSRL